MGKADTDAISLQIVVKIEEKVLVVTSGEQQEFSHTLVNGDSFDCKVIAGESDYMVSTS